MVPYLKTLALALYWEVPAVWKSLRKFLDCFRKMSAFEDIGSNPGKAMIILFYVTGSFPFSSSAKIEKTVLKDSQVSAAATLIV